MSIHPTVVARRTLVPGAKYSFDELTVQAGDGSGRSWLRQVVRHPGAVIVVPILDDGRLVFIRNYRVAVEPLRGGAWLLEFCAGTLDRPGEPVVDAAARELIEETGYQADEILPLMGTPDSPGYFYTTPGLTDERMYPFFARGLASVGQHLEADESIHVLTLPPAEAWNALDKAGSVDDDKCTTLMDAKSIVALTLAARRGLLSF